MFGRLKAEISLASAGPIKGHRQIDISYYLLTYLVTYLSIYLLTYLFS